MSTKSARNLTEYSAAVEAAKNGKGTEVTLEAARSILIKHVSKEFESLKYPEEFKCHAEGGGFLVETQNKIFLMPLYDREENKIDISTEELMDTSTRDKTPATNFDTTISGHLIVETINADIHILSSEIQGMDNDSPGCQFRKNTEIITDHMSFIESVEKNGLDTVYIIRDYNKFPNPANKPYPMHLRLDKGIINPLITKHLQGKMPKVNPDFPLLEMQRRIIHSLDRSGYPELAETAKAYYSNKLPLPVIFADKLCTTQGYGNHYAIMNNYHQANDQARYHESWMKNVRPEEIVTVNTLKQDKIDLVTKEFQKFTEFLNDNKKDLASIKELQPLLKRIVHNVKEISSTNKNDHSL